LPGTSESDLRIYLEREAEIELLMDRRCQ